MDVQHVLVPPINSTDIGDASVHHILSGSFRSLSLLLLAFSPSKRSISLLQSIPAFGPHQYLASNQDKSRIYTTSWALPPSLSSWHVERSDSWRISHINTVPITATSSYITMPPPYTHAYSVGGPTGESHLIDKNSGGLGEKVQEILFVSPSDLERADKTRVALRYGSHGIEFTPSLKHAFVPVLGSNTIEMYAHDSASGHLTHITSVESPRGKDAKDGPRHLKIHPNGNLLYCVTEHSNYVDAYHILPTSLEYVSSRSILPRNTSLSQSTTSNHHFRGDTLMLTPSTSRIPNPQLLITTTRGASSDVRGWLSFFPLAENGNFSPLESIEEADQEAERFQTPTSGGKANAIDILPKGEEEDGLWILLTDDDELTASPNGTGAVRVLEWDGWGKGGAKIVA
ncbi:hypothetical protein M413DRAFT_447166 [Hebeloma cylindrosporum]|uniref:Muconate cycloisomerase 1 n=1 Tax=Hebeloma cylindrosporum TaxID=76867 RepID=A0A0C2XNG8_HEBCY|nr:hypothetical protein M413DRAFT_447166 [Hebeloma cylindrosporum h7]